MTQSTRLGLFLVWLAIVTLGCLDMAFSRPSLLAQIVLPMAWLPFAWGDFRKELPRPVSYKVMVVVGLFLLLIAWGALSGFNQASDAWVKEHPQARMLLAGNLWLAWLILGSRRFLAKRFLV